MMGLNWHSLRGLRDRLICYGKQELNETSRRPGGTMDAASIIRDLALRPHPEGGHYRETFRDTLTLGSGNAARGASTAIYYLLQAGERSHWHRVDAAELWHWYAGAPLTLTVSEDGRAAGAREIGDECGREKGGQEVELT